MTSQNPTSEVPYVDNPTIEYTSGKALMKHGPDVMHDHLSSRMEASIRGALSQMEVRFKNLSITADIVVSNNKNEAVMPTLPNTLWQAFMPSSKRTETRHILKDVNGVFKPGTMTLVLGQPGSGKSSLMKILSGRFPMTSSTKVQGEILYNGAGKDENGVRQRIPQFVSYVTQRDNHIPTLTVKETLEFAHECCGGELSKHAADVFTKGTPEENKAALEAAQAWIKHYPEIVTQQLGLEHCQDTVVGDAMLRGVSGGERKRVTTGEMQFGNKSVILMDEISTGLDSAASYDIVKTQRSLARKMRKTVVIALLQPSPEIFELFDDVLIMNQGRVIYHGPQAQALEYFESLGFVRPVGRDVADFLLDIGTEQQRKYETGLPPGSMYPRKASELAAIFENSAIHAEMLKDLHAPHDPDLIRDREDYFENIPEFHQSFWESTMTVTRRQLKVTMRNVPFIASRIFMILLVGTLNATVYWQIDPKDAQIVMGVLFQSVLFLSFSQLSQVPSFYAAREIFYKQRAANFYRTSSYVFAFTVSQIPIVLAEVLTFGSMIYFMCGFTWSFTQYILFLGILFAIGLAFGAFFFATACTTPNINIGQPIGVLFVTFFVLYGGFAIADKLLPDWLVWIYWVNPIAWAMRALAINEYGRDKYNVDVYDGVDYMGQYGKTMGAYSLDLVGLSTDINWIVYSIIYIAGAYILLSVISFVSLEYFRFEAPEKSGLVGEEDHVWTGESGSESNYALAATPRGTNDSDTILELTPTPKYRKAAPVALAFKDLWYTVPNPQNPKEGLDLLKGINGYALPGTITALMGSSGAGKTTLMDVIAGRKTGGEIRGQILLNGHEATPLAIQRSTGYCEQMDIHSESSTFREAFTFSAFLRQDASISASEKYDWVEECIDLLDLRPIADRIIRGSSVEQMKRLTIGVELAAQPSVLFLDEPTSGLDARSAKIVMDSVRKVADTGRTVVCTIHQPSAEVFQVFDNLLLLKRGGFTVYFGELGTNASNLIHYLQSIPGVTPLPEGYNPATWMLEVIGAGVESKKAGRETDFVEIFNKSEHKAITMDNLNRIGVGRPDPSVPALAFANKRAASESTQAKMLMQRFWNMYWRTPSYNLTRFVIYTFLGLVLGLTFNDLTYTSYRGINSGLAMVFMASTFLGYIAVMAVVPMVGEERPSFYRERACQTYNTLWYAIGATAMEIPYVFSSTLVMSAIVFPLVDFSGTKEFFLFWLFLAMYALMTTYIGMFFTYASPSIEVGTVFGIILTSITVLFMGFNPPINAIPSGYKWLYQITPPRYALDALSTVVFGNCDGDPSTIACFTMNDAPPTIRAGITVAELLDDVFNMRYDNVERNFFILLGCIIFFAVLSLLSLRFINHQKR